MKNIQNLQFADYIDMVKRRFLLILIPAILLGLCGVFVVRLIPNIFISETVILVEPQKIPSEYVRSTSTTPIESRLSTITQQIMSRTRLEKIIIDNNLYVEMRRNLPMEDVVEKMRKDINLRVNKADAFTLSYQSKDPALAQRVTQQIASLYIEENLKDREEQTEGVSQFLQVQLQETEVKLKDLETKLSDFKSRNMGALPEQEQANLSALGRLQQQLQASLDSNNRLQEQRIYQQRLLREMENLRAQEKEAAAAADSNGSPKPGVSIADKSTPLDLKRAELVVLLQRYTKDHPDVKKLVSEIALLEKVQEANNKHTIPSPVGEAGHLPSKVRQVTPADAEIAQMKSRIELLDDQIKQGEKEQGKIRQDMAVYQVRVDAVPRIEQMQKEISRDYDITRQHYQTLLAKKNDAEMASSLEKRQKGEQFRVIDPASFPQKPAKPNRLVLNLAGFALGLAFGLGLAILLELADESIRSEHELAVLAGVPVLVSIPWLDDSGDLGNQKNWWKKMKLSLFHHNSGLGE
jgi:polysaccharide chain length determinant protein (PEP-CTERM system associated)